MEFCAPTIIYLLISIIAFVAEIAYLNVNGNNVSQKIDGEVVASYTKREFILYIVINIVFTVLWALLLNYLCSINWKELAWALLLLPYIIIFLLVIFGVEISEKNPELMTSRY